MMVVLIDIVTWLFLLTGSFFVLAGGVGFLRMPDLYSRMHASSLTESLGAILVLTGLMVQGGFTLVTVKLIIILFFLLFTSPTAAYALANAALLAGVKPRASRLPEQTEGDGK